MRCAVHEKWSTHLKNLIPPCTELLEAIPVARDEHQCQIGLMLSLLLPLFSLFLVLLSIAHELLVSVQERDVCMHEALRRKLGQTNGHPALRAALLERLGAVHCIDEQLAVGRVDAVLTRSNERYDALPCEEEDVQ